MLSLILFDIFDKKIDTRRFLIYCNKVEFFFDLLNDSVRLTFSHDE